MIKMRDVSETAKFYEDLEKAKSTDEKAKLAVAWMLKKLKQKSENEKCKKV